MLGAAVSAAASSWRGCLSACKALASPAEWGADDRTHTGEQRRQLPWLTGIHVTLNTQTSIARQVPWRGPRPLTCSVARRPSTCRLAAHPSQLWRVSAAAWRGRDASRSVAWTARCSPRRVTSREPCRWNIPLRCQGIECPPASRIRRAHAQRRDQCRAGVAPISLAPRY
ncbi:hypothetical protein ACU4GD_31860 [Cupriavidus basilensis]